MENNKIHYHHDLIQIHRAKLEQVFQRLARCHL